MGSITEFRGSVCAPGRNAYIAEGSAPVGAGAQLDRPAGARGRQLSSHSRFE